MKPYISFTSHENRLLKAANGQSYKNAESPFRATLTMFRNYINYTDPLSFDEWLAVADDHKAAILYVQFFDQISLAWYKLRTDAAIEEDCVEEVLQYLMKNVPLIKQNKSKFSERYIYKICYNCIYCKSIDPYKGQTAKTSWFNNTTSQYVYADNEHEIDLCDSTPCNDEAIECVMSRQQFWAIIEDMGADTLSVVSKLLGDGFDPEYRVSKANQAKILDELRERLAPYKELFY